MKKIRWIIQSNLIKTEILESFRQIFIKNQIAFKEVFVIPFSEEIEHQPDPAYFDIFYGSTTLMLNVYKSENLKKGVFYDEATFQMKKYIEKWEGSCLNTDAIFSTIPEFVKNHENEAQNWFIRPNADTKSISGSVMTFEEIKELSKKLDLLDNPELNANTLFVFSKPKKIEKEWRNYIVNGKVISTVQYQQNGQKDITSENIPEGLREFSEDSCATYLPHR